VTFTDLRERESERRRERAYRERNRERLRERWRQCFAQDPEKFRMRWRAYHEKNREKIRAKDYSRHLILKVEVIRHYAPSLSCQRCGFDDIRALSIDHIDGGGRRHGRAIGIGSGSGHHLYRWLKKNGYPLGFQVLCMNCQWIKAHENKELRRIRKGTYSFEQQVRRPSPLGESSSQT